MTNTEVINPYVDSAAESSQANSEGLQESSIEEYNKFLISIPLIALTVLEDH